MKKPLVYLYLILLAGVLSCRSAEKEQVDSSSYENDSIAEIEAQQKAAEEVARKAIEQARLDSLRQDSLNRNFSTFDLSFHQLHGKVKEVKWDNGWNEKNVYMFNEEGSWINDGWTKTDKEYIAPFARSNMPKQKTIRDSEGKIIKSYYSCNDGGDFDYYSFTWKNGRIIDDSVGTFSYNTDGTLAKYDQVHHSYIGLIQPSIIYYFNYKFDHFGNWIERTMKVETWDVDSGTPEFIDKEIKKEKRTISYY